MMIPTNGINLHVESHAQNGEPVIFLHFGNGHLGAWAPLLPAFVDRYWVVTMDMRGHGASDKPDGGYTISDLAEDVLGVMDHLGIEKAHFVGSSMGAEVSLRLAATHPERVIDLVLEQAFQNAFGPHSTYGAFSEAKLADLRARRAARAPLTADTCAGALANLLERWGRPGVTAGHFYDFACGAIGPNGYGQYDLRCPSWVTSAYVEDFWTTRFEQDFARVRCPVLFLPDEESLKDSEVRASMAWFTGLLKDCRVKLIPGAEHAAVWLDHPKACAEAVLEFFKGGRS